MLATRALFEVPNLDNMSTDPADLDDAAKVLNALAAYALAKAECMRHRLAGNTSLACNLEVRLDARYAKLPDWARW